jgi:5-methylcytosine-specific restriction endonuclease McrA
MNAWERTKREVFERDKGYCQYCEQDLLLSRATYNGHHIDHVIARAKSGSDKLENLKLACATCNLGLSRQIDLTTFEERKEYINKRTNEYHEPWYRELKSKLRK